MNTTEHEAITSFCDGAGELFRALAVSLRTMPDTEGAESAISGDTATDSDGLPRIDAAHRYFSHEAAELLGESVETLRKWRLNSTGPKYTQAVPRGTVKHLGLWLIEFRRSTIRDSEATP